MRFKELARSWMISAFYVLVCIFIICINFRLKSWCHVQGLEPVTITPDGNCLYHSSSKILFGTEKYWTLVKIGAFTFFRSKIDIIIKWYVRWYVSAVFLMYFFSEIFRCECSCVCYWTMQRNFNKINRQSTDQSTRALWVFCELLTVMSKLVTFTHVD